MATILVVDDDPDIRDLIQEILEGAGHDVTVAAVVRKLATAVRRRRVLQEELAQAVEILRVEQPRVPIFEALDRFDLDEVFRRHAALPFSHLGLTV